MKTFLGLLFLSPVLAVAADVSYTVRVANLKVDTSKLECREITFGFSGELKAAS